VDLAPPLVPAGYLVFRFRIRIRYRHRLDMNSTPVKRTGSTRTKLQRRDMSFFGLVNYHHIQGVTGQAAFPRTTGPVLSMIALLSKHVQVH
jgi:hypothetical protein